MEGHTRVCPFCGDQPGVGVFCAVCGRNLSAVEQLPTRAEWEAGASSPAAAATDARPLVERCTQATAAFLSAMHAAGDPGTVKRPMSGGSGFRRPREIDVWVVRAVHREDEDDIESLRQYDPGLVLTTEGSFHRLDSEVRGWGQRDFPRFFESIPPDPIDMPVEERLLAELATVLRAHGPGDEPSEGAR
jgi:hypothetical protein